MWPGKAGEAELFRSQLLSGLVREGEKKPQRGCTGPGCEWGQHFKNRRACR